MSSWIDIYTVCHYPVFPQSYCWPELRDKENPTALSVLNYLPLRDATLTLNRSVDGAAISAEDALKRARRIIGLYRDHLPDSIISFFALFI
jgi:hypothetical protein